MHAFQSLAAPEPFELWLIDLADGDDARLSSANAVLGDAERARAGRFRFERDRRRYLLAHLALRELLAARTGVAATRIDFVDNEFGKPRLAHAPACAFNLSHSEDLALVAIASDGDIGVDIEILRTPADIDALARHCFTPSEQAELAAVSAPERGRAFLQGWTRKEACLKAVGAGLSIEPGTFTAGLQAVDARVRVPFAPDGAETIVHSITNHEEFVAAVSRLLSPSFHTVSDADRSRYID